MRYRTLQDTRNVTQYAKIVNVLYGASNVITVPYKHFPFYWCTLYDVPEGSRVMKPCRHEVYSRNLDAISLKVNGDLYKTPKGNAIEARTLSQFVNSNYATRAIPLSKNLFEQSISSLRATGAPSLPEIEAVIPQVDASYLSWKGRTMNLVWPRDMSPEPDENRIVGYTREHLFSLATTTPTHLLIDPLDDVSRVFPWDKYQKRVKEKIRPSLNDGQFSLLNFLIELKELEELTSLFSEAAKGFPKFLRALQSASKSSSPSTACARVILDQAASLHLATFFGIIPFVSDLRTIVAKITSVTSAYDNFVGRANVLASKHSSFDLDPQQFRAIPLGVTQRTVRSQFQDISFTETIGFKPFTHPRYTGTTNYWYDIPGLSGTMARLRGYLDYFGVALDPAIVWNAIPFSFLVDWVVGVGAFLHELRIDNLEAVVHLEDFCESYKMEFYRAVTVEGGQVLANSEGVQLPFQGAISGTTLVGYENLSLYGRTKSVPYEFEKFGLQDGILNVKRALLGLSLANANWNNIIKAFGFDSNRGIPDKYIKYRYDYYARWAKRWNNDLRRVIEKKRGH